MTWMAPSRETLFDLARCVLPAPPEPIEVILGDGGSLAVPLLGFNDDLVMFHAPSRWVRKKLRIWMRVDASGGGGYELGLEVADTFFHTGEEALVHATVTAVRRRKARRCAPRVALDD